VVIALRSGGRTFQALGPATTNALSAVLVLLLGMRKSPRLVERNRSSVQTLHSSARYAGAKPYLTSNISTHSLYTIRLSTGSHRGDTHDTSILIVDNYARIPVIRGMQVSEKYRGIKSGGIIYRGLVKYRSRHST